MCVQESLQNWTCRTAGNKRFYIFFVISFSTDDNTTEGYKLFYVKQYITRELHGTGINYVNKYIYTLHSVYRPKFHP